MVDLEVKDARVIFTPVWKALEDEVGRESLRFPKEIILLGGAPGASYPPITISVDVGADAVSTTNSPTVVGHGGVWRSTASDPIEVRRTEF